MCFSAEASFGASAVLGVVGVVAVRKTTRRDQMLFAAIPIFFALQQFSEGFVWLSLTRSDWILAARFPSYFFVTFALLVWPVWLPLAVWLLEKPGRPKRLLGIFAGSGTVFALILSFYLFSHSVTPEIESHHIHYALGFKGSLVKGLSLLYFLPTILPPFFSGYKWVRLMGLFLLISYLVSRYYFGDAVVSVWCFMATFISFLVLLVLHSIRKNGDAAKL